jgi:hypothetical protein
MGRDTSAFRVSAYKPRGKAKGTGGQPEHGRVRDDRFKIGRSLIGFALHYPRNAEFSFLDCFLRCQRPPVEWR